MPKSAPPFTGKQGDLEAWVMHVRIVNLEVLLSTLGL